MTKFELTVLGTSSALPTLQRYPTAHVLNVHERFFLIDCGEGTQIQLRRNKIRTSRLNYIFISHLHGDHYFGLIGLLSTFALLGRKNDLHIFSHSELPEILKPQLEFMELENAFHIVWHPINFKRPSVILDDEHLTVTTFPLNHRIPCCGFHFVEKPAERHIIKEKLLEYEIPLREIPFLKKGHDFVSPDGKVIANSELTLTPRKPRSYSFCTDTTFLPHIAEYIKNTDLLYHEATYDKLLSDRAAATFHSTAEQAAQMAVLAQASKLILGHFSARYPDCNLLLTEAQAIFPNTECAEEGKVFTID
jgi:ribonuclease Z